MEGNSCTEVCRFCLETSDRNFETIEEVTLANLDFLWLKLNLSISEEPVMCGNCAKIIKTCSDFKEKCLGIENRIVSSGKHKDSINIDLLEVYVSKMPLEHIVKIEDLMVCRLCLEAVENESAIFLRNGTDVQKLEQYFPELDLTCTEDPVICAFCQISLQNYFSFINTCLTTEEKITECCKVEGTNGKGQIVLNNVKHFFSKNSVKCEFDVDALKIEELHNEDSKNSSNDVEIKKAGILNVELDIKKDTDNEDSETGSNDVEIKKEEILDMELDIKKDTDNEDSETGSNDVEIKKEEILDMELDIKENIFMQASELTYENSFQHHPSTSQSDCAPQPITDKIEMQSHGNNPNIVSKDIMHKCDLCDHKTKWKMQLKRHMLTHKPNSEVTMYKCDKCSFETKHKGSLRFHVLIHMNVSKMEMHKCDVCPFKTKWKSSLAKHRLLHGNTSNLIMQGKLYKCELCDYEGKKGNVKKHMLTHKSPSEVTMYKCASCVFETKHKDSLRQHMLTHMEVKMHKCDVCPFKTNWKKGLRKHRLLHGKKKTSDLITQGKLYECDLCDYVGKRKSCLKMHMLTHKPASEVTMYKCDACIFETRYRLALVGHRRIHMDVSEVDMKISVVNTQGTLYKCELCDYEGKRGNVKKHMLTHKSPSEVTMYKCASCVFETKHKDYLHQHMLIHRMEMHKCEVCPFKTKWKKTLRKHLLKHRNPSEVITPL